MTDTFSALAPRLAASGWLGLIPLRPHQKIPGISRWQRFNRGQAPAELRELIESRVGNRAGSGVGQAAGNGVVWLDFDMLDAKAITRAVVIAEDHCGITPIHKIGKAPKRALAYRSDGITSRKYPRGISLEVFGGAPRSSGQVALYAVHPDTGRPYQYPHQSPLDTPALRLPEIFPEQLEALIEALARDRIVSQAGRAPQRCTSPAPSEVASNRGITLVDASQQNDLSEWVAATTPGGRHAAAIAACTVAMSRGLDADDEFALLEAIEISFKEAKPESTAGEWADIVRWARRRARKRPRSELERRLGIGGGHGHQ